MKRPDLRSTTFAFASAFVLLPSAEAQDTEDGKLAFNNACRTCHSMRPDDNRLGPSLHGVVGRKAGTLKGYTFSPAMQNSGITWDEETLDKFIANPDQVVRGNAMKPYGGIADEGERKKIIAYLATLK